MSVSKPKNDYVIEKITREYLRLLGSRPILTKACTSAFTAALGNVISQVLTKSPVQISPNRAAAFAATGFFFVGPSFHYFYTWLESAVPKDEKHSGVKRIIIDRLIWTPAFLSAYLYILALIEVHEPRVAIGIVKAMYWTALKMNWKIFSVLQFINVNYIPQQYRVLFGSAIGLFWNIYISTHKK